MSLKDIEVKSEYRSLSDDVTKDFYIPLLKQAVEYKRAVGFFSSSALIEISRGITGLVKNGGKILLVASPHLSSEDIEAIKTGYDLRDNLINKALSRELYETDDVYEQGRLNLLANLISDGILDIKIAFPENQNEVGMYHEKMGIISDALGNKVAFSGSMNESRTAMKNNYETIDVFRSWKNEFEEERATAKDEAFNFIWNNNEPNIRIIDFPKIKEEIIEKYKRSDPNYDIDDQQFEYEDNDIVAESPEKYRIGARIPSSVKLHDYQIEAIDEWEKNGYRGIFDMATGTGKTFTGLGAVARLSNNLDSKLSVIIVCPYQHLVEQWVEDIIRFNIDPIIGYSSSKQKNWKKRLKSAIKYQSIGLEDSEFICLICTNATFRSDYVQEQIDKIKGDILIVVDEAHNFGSFNLSRLLDDRFNYRLALSATLERHMDEDGTNSLYKFFDKKCIEYGLDRAIAEKKLTKYKYYPIVIYLNDVELEEYNNLSAIISKNMMQNKDGSLIMNEYAKRIAIKRARIVAAAENKLSALKEIIEPYKEKNNILVYCGAANVFYEDLNEGEEDVQVEMRQIDAVTKILGYELDMKVAKFTSQETSEERKLRKEAFENEKLQALIAIKCLDEGVNIPNIRTAFILASTTNPKEYIQRRGRVLRTYPGKDIAEIYDFITLPRPLDGVKNMTKIEMNRELTLVKNELNRMEEFSQLSENRLDSYLIISDIKNTYEIQEEE